MNAENQLDVDRFYRYQETLQELFDEAAGFETDLGNADAGLPHGMQSTG